MALSKIDAANFLDGTLPDTNINNASLDNVTGLPAGVGGKVLQVVSTANTSFTNTTSTTYVATNLTLNITPSSTSSKIFIVSTFTTYQNVSGNSAYVTLYRDSTDLAANNKFMNYWDDTGRTIGNPAGLSYLDSPSSTSQLTYAIYYKTQSGGTTYINYDNSTGSITAYEIAG